MRAELLTTDLYISKKSNKKFKVQVLSMFLIFGQISARVFYKVCSYKKNALKRQMKQLAATRACTPVIKLFRMGGGVRGGGFQRDGVAPRNTSI